MIQQSGCISGLPLELLHIIAKELDRSTLDALSMTCWQARLCLEPVILARIYIQSGSAFEGLRKAVEQRPRYKQFLKSIRLKVSGGKVWKSNKDYLRFLAALPVLNSLSVRYDVSAALPSRMLDLVVTEPSSFVSLEDVDLRWDSSLRPSWPVVTSLPFLMSPKVKSVALSRFEIHRQPGGETTPVRNVLHQGKDCTITCLTLEHCVVSLESFVSLLQSLKILQILRLTDCSFFDDESTFKPSKESNYGVKVDWIGILGIVSHGLRSLTFVQNSPSCDSITTQPTLIPQDFIEFPKLQCLSLDGFRLALGLGVWARDTIEYRPLYLSPLLPPNLEHLVISRPDRTIFRYLECIARQKHEKKCKIQRVKVLDVKRVGMDELNSFAKRLYNLYGCYVVGAELFAHSLFFEMRFPDPNQPRIEQPTIRWKLSVARHHWLFESCTQDISAQGIEFDRDHRNIDIEKVEITGDRID